MNPRGFALLGCCGGVSVWGVSIAVCRFLCAGRYIALLIEHEWGGPQHLAYGGIKLPGILFMTWRAQGDMSGWLLVFLFTMCCHKAYWAVVRLVAFQGVWKKPCMLPPIGGNLWSCLIRVNFSHFLPFDFVVGILGVLVCFVMELLFIIPLCKKERAFLSLFLALPF